MRILKPTEILSLKDDQDLLKEALTQQRISQLGFNIHYCELNAARLIIWQTFRVVFHILI